MILRTKLQCELCLRMCGAGVDSASAWGQFGGGVILLRLLPVLGIGAGLVRSWVNAQDWVFLRKLWGRGLKTGGSKFGISFLRY